MSFFHRFSARGKVFEYFVVGMVVICAGAVSFIFLSETLANTRDVRRLSDITALRSALELYYLDHGAYPSTGWTNSATTSWGVFGTMLSPYVAEMPRDPINDPSGPIERVGAFNYSYYSSGKSDMGEKHQNYILVFRLEKPEAAYEYQQADVGLVTARGTVRFLDLTHADGIYVVRAP